MERNAARQGRAILSTVIATSCEDALPAILRLPATDGAWVSRMDGLLQLGRDVQALAAAASVLHRLSIEEERP